MKVIAALFLPIALLCFLFGTGLLEPSIMDSWCKGGGQWIAGRWVGCGGKKLWTEYPLYYRQIVILFGISFSAFAVLIFSGHGNSSRLFNKASEPAAVPISPAQNLTIRLLGVSIFFGFAIPLYWIAVLEFSRKPTMGAMWFWAPIAILVLVVLPTEIQRFRSGKRFNEQ